MSSLISQPQHPPTETLRQEFQDAVSPGSLLLGIGTGALCLLFLFTYLAAFHNPTPHRVDVAVVAPASVANRVVDQLNALEGEPVEAVLAPNQQSARRSLEHNQVAGVFIVSSTGRRDQLLVASGGAVTLVSALNEVFTRVDAAQQRTVEVVDVVPHQRGDASGGSVFYVVLGCLLAGYLLASSISSARGSRPATLRRTLWRLGTTVPYAILVGFGAALITDHGLGALTGHFTALWAVGTLLVLASATTTIAFQIMFGFLGITATILIFVVLGSPSSGGAYPYSLLPPFLRTIGPYLPNGAGVDALRRAIYFNGTGVAPRVWIIIGWAAIGAIAAITASFLQHRRARGTVVGDSMSDAEVSGRD